MRGIKRDRVDLIRKQKLGTVLRDIHAQMPKHPIDFNKVGDFEIRGGYLEGKKIRRLIIYLRAHGCEYALNDENGGCTMCGHLAGTSRGEGVSVHAFIRQIDDLFSTIDLTNIPMVCIYNAGSFFNEKEMPEQARTYIYKKLAMVETVTSIIFESRPEYITDEEMKKMKHMLPAQRIEIGIGLESANEYIRQICLNKGFNMDAFRSASTMLKENGVYLLTYVLQKPPFVNEQMAIADTVSTAKWAFAHGADVVSIEPVSVQKNTLVHLLYTMTCYRPPWIWSVLSAIKGIGPLGLLRIGGFEFFPPPDVCTHNCSVCNDSCIKAVEEFNVSNDFDLINKNLAMLCENCKDAWLDALKDTATIEQNIDRFFEQYHKDSLEELLRTALRRYPKDVSR